MHILALVISILVELNPDGSAAFTEQWSVDATRGTEWYLVKSNLADIGIRDFSVSENGSVFIQDTPWNVDRSLSEKAGRCGMVYGKDGYELCWGLGSMGHHDFTVNYTMTNVVKSLGDYDMLHMQLVSPGLSDKPDRVRVEIRGPEQFTSDNTLIWGFGYEGNSCLRDGSAIFESSVRFSSKSSVIALLRFEKGIFNSPSIQDRYFDEVLETALEGASFSNDVQVKNDTGEDVAGILASVLTFLGVILGAIGGVRRSRRKILGCNEKDIEWSRDIPFGGDILQSCLVLDKLGRNGRDNVAAAMILRMIQRGQLISSKDGKGNIELSFGPQESLEGLSGSETTLWNMMKQASGSDVILQKNEFGRWSRRHQGTIMKWVDAVNRDGLANAGESGCMNAGKFTPEGQKEARKLLGFKKFLKDFTLLEIRGSSEVGLWQDYLVFGALFGIAEKVAAELKDIHPEIFEQTPMYDYETTRQLVLLTRNMAANITNVRAAQTQGHSRSGFGGVSSFGGGGGFSGGGFGGGAR